LPPLKERDVLREPPGGGVVALLLLGLERGEGVLVHAGIGM
jgi:hypothetical protein